MGAPASITSCAAVVAASLCQYARAVCCASCPAPEPELGTALGDGNHAYGYASLAAGSAATADGFASIALGYNVSATKASAVALGQHTRTFSDPSADGGDSCGACMAMGSYSMAVGDYSTAMGSGTISRGYCSTAMGEGTEAKAFGEVALGLYTENDGPYTPSYPVTPSALDPEPYVWQSAGGPINVTQRPLNYSDSVLRVGIGYCEEYATTPNTPFTTCNSAVRIDGLRLLRDGTLYLRKADGSGIADVQAAIEALQQASGRRLEEVEEERRMQAKRIEATLEARWEAKFEQARMQLEATKEQLEKLTARLEQLEK